MSHLDAQILVSQAPDYWAGAREHVAIVRELAEAGPVNVAAPDRPDTCAFCEQRYYGHLDMLENHEPSCLWRRSKALYPGAPA